MYSTDVTGLGPLVVLGFTFSACILRQCDPKQKDLPEIMAALNRYWKAG